MCRSLRPPQIEILGGRDAYLPRMLTAFDRAQLPTEFGGDLVIPGGAFPVS